MKFDFKIANEIEVMIQENWKKNNEVITFHSNSRNLSELPMPTQIQ